MNKKQSNIPTYVNSSTMDESSNEHSTLNIQNTIKRCDELTSLNQNKSSF